MCERRLSGRWLTGVCLSVAASMLVPGSGLKAGPPAPADVQLTHREGKWQLTRNGQPFAVKGAGGTTALRLLAQAGGNSLRTWDADAVRPILDEAQGLGLTVTVGLWLGHEEQGFRYTDREQVAAQRDRVRQAVLRYKDHPAVLLWGIGNEMEGFKAGDNPAIWSEVNNLAAMIKKLDPRHPTMTVIAEIGGRRVDAVNRLCPDVDIVGINSYGGVASLPGRYRKLGGKKPYVVTEFGPPGPWEIRKNSWGAAEEPTSTKKAGYYRAAYEALAADAELCLGSYAFLWGHKQETTATWFGMLLPDGSRLEAADTMFQLWSGKPPQKRSPRIEPLAVIGAAQVGPAAAVQVRLTAADPQGAPLKVQWVLTADDAEDPVGGAPQAAPPAFPAAIIRGDLNGAELRMPQGGGGYRLYAYVDDGHGGAAVANVPLRVTGPPQLRAALPAQLPFVLLGGQAAPYVPSGWMGDIKAIRLDAQCTDQPRAGGTCLKCEYVKPDGWGGVVWQHPENNWGDKPGGYDLAGATRLAFWARGKEGGEKVKFGFGVLGADKKYHDTAQGQIELTLTNGWRQYAISLKDQNLHRIISGFFWSVGGQGQPVIFYLDGVQYQ